MTTFDTRAAAISYAQAWADTYGMYLRVCGPTRYDQCWRVHRVPRPELQFGRDLDGELVSPSG
jgi:hypothetical protein